MASLVHLPFSSIEPSLVVVDVNCAVNAHFPDADVAADSVAPGPSKIIVDLYSGYYLMIGYLTLN